MNDDLWIDGWADFEPPDLDVPVVPRANGHHPGAAVAVAARPRRTRATRDAQPADGHMPLPSDIELGGNRIAVNNPAKVADWLREELGTGPLSGVFNRDGLLVHTPREGEDGYDPPKDDRNNDGPAQIRIIDASRLASRCQYTYECVKHVRDKETGTWKTEKALFPQTAAKIPVDVPDLLPNVRPLRGVVHSPVLRPDGSLVDQPGYDHETGLLYLPERGLEVPAIPAEPTQWQTRKALVLIDQMLGGFVFSSESDRANYLGLLMTPLLRAMLPPPYKLGAIGAPMPGSGKSLLAALLRHVHGGVFRAEIPADEAELRKQVTSILDVTTGPIVQFDNVSGVLRSATMAGLLTSPDWDDRQLGATKMVRAVNDRLWIVTGNNLTLGGDLIRRTLWVTIDPGVPNPHMRTGFAIDDLEGWVKARRGDLLAALLTLARSWVAAGSPTVKDRSDSYALWTGALRGLLRHAGVPGTFDNASTARQKVGADDTDWAAFLGRAHHVFGDKAWTVAELLGRVSVNGVDGKPISSDLLPGDLAEKFERNHSVSKSLGRWMANREGRWADGFAVRSAGEDRNHVRMWTVTRWEERGEVRAA